MVSGASKDDFDQIMHVFAISQKVLEPSCVLSSRRSRASSHHKLFLILALNGPFVFESSLKTLKFGSIMRVVCGSSVVSDSSGVVAVPASVGQLAWLHSNVSSKDIKLSLDVEAFFIFRSDMFRIAFDSPLALLSGLYVFIVAFV